MFENRRTFAIISHPDAGKTTLTEKLLLFGGAIHLAGAVKAKKGGKSATSDWMAIEQQRGISVTASVMTFEYGGCTVNLLDTPGHKDFSEDTYRTLTAVDSAVMVLDGAKGIEAQTLKLFEVCRLRDVPILTFINKFDRESQSPFALLDEIESRLALNCCPMTWPIGMGERFRGVFNLVTNQFLRFEPGKDYIPAATHATSIQKSLGLNAQSGGGDEIIIQEVEKNASAIEESDFNRLSGNTGEETHFLGVDDPALDEIIPAAELATFREEVAMVRGVYPAFNREEYPAGHLTPVFFGSAINNFGVRELLQGLCDYAPAPRPRAALEREVQPGEPKFSGFVFKIQANMDKNHRDRIAFVRICSGKYSRGMKALHVRAEKTLTLNNPVLFLARERELAEEAYAGDILGIPGHGHLRIGDTLTEGEALHFTGIPSFAAEVFQRVRLNDPLKSKQLKEALTQLSEEGASQIFKPLDGSPWIVGVVGPLQFDVIASRLEGEYGVRGQFEAVTYTTARWVECADKKMLDQFTEKNKYNLAEDARGALAYLAPNDWHLARLQQDWPEVKLLKTKEA